MRFASVTLPEIGDNLYDLYLLNDTDFHLAQKDLRAGETYDFGPEGVDQFRVLGIEKAVELDPNDVTAFITELTFTDTGPFTGTMTPILPVDFSNLEIENAKIKLHHRSNRDWFEVRGRFALGDNSNGIGVLDEDVVVGFGSFLETIYAGSFLKKGKTYRYYGGPGGITSMVIKDNGKFKIIARRLDLHELYTENPVPFALQINEDLGEAEIVFDKKGRFRNFYHYHD